MDKFLSSILIFFGTLFIIVILGLILAWPVQILWNSCLVHAFKGALNEISYLQAYGILLLSQLLFKNTLSNTKK